MICPADTGPFRFVETIEVSLCMKHAFHPTLVFDTWVGAHVFQLTPDFRRHVLPKLESYRPPIGAAAGVLIQYQLHVWELKTPTTLQDAWYEMPGNTPIPWPLLEALRDARDGQTNYVLTRDGADNLVSIPGDRPLNGEGQPYGDPTHVPLALTYQSGMLRRIWQIKPWDTNAVEPCPMSMRVLTLA